MQHALPRAVRPAAAAALSLLAAMMALAGSPLAGQSPAGQSPASQSAAAAAAEPAGAEANGPRLITSRENGRDLLADTLPKEEDTFGFLVFGDRTGGPKKGIEVLQQAVADANLLDPDLVMTVGDLINGYNTREPWLKQAREYHETMSKLRMPWFPVAGNHDIYWRGKGKPPEEHEGNYEAVFGPLWYAVHHKKCWFVVLYSDEGNPETGERNFNKEDCQRISPEQFGWLEQTLGRAKSARHVFVFLHHPRWQEHRYGEDWRKVHKLLADTGNVRAVFAGHIHNMQFGGVRDGIAYYTVASVGAHLGMEAPQAGYLHEYHVVTVRPEGIRVAAIPVGGVIDPETITTETAEDALRVHKGLRAEVLRVQPAGGSAAVQKDGSVDAVVTLGLRNEGKRAIELEIVPNPQGALWTFGPDHQHLVVAPESTGETTFAVRRSKSDVPFALPTIEVRCDYLASDRRIALPIRAMTMDLPPPEGLGNEPAANNGVLVLDGESCLRVDSERADVPDGPLTLECWLQGSDFNGRRGLLAKTESSEFGIFCSDGKLDFSVHLDGRYVTAASAGAALKPGSWHHVAGVFDGSDVRLYLDGKLLARKAGSGKRTRNELPLYLGADVKGNGDPTSYFTGRLDEIRLSKVARYRGESFSVPQRHQADADTVLLIPCDRSFGPWVPDSGPAHSHPVRVGSAYCTVAKR
ncbi:MAG: LamG-like jellyroll fold domain-containing protein [Planctomycetota bacterium]